MADNARNRALAMALMQSGLGMIANSQVPYGHSVIPGMAGALGYGLNTFGRQMQLERENEMQRRQEEDEMRRRRSYELLLGGITGPNADMRRAAAMVAPQQFAKSILSPDTGGSDRLYDVVGPDGKPVKATAAQAVGKEPYMAPRAAAGSGLSKLISEMNALPPGDPGVALYRKAIMKDISFAPPMMVQSYQTPIPVVDPDSGETVMAQFGNRGAEPLITNYKPAPKEVQMKAETMTAGVKAKLASKKTALQQVLEAKDVLKKNPGAFGPMNFMPDLAVQALDPEGAPARAALGGATAKMRHELMGSAVSAGERASYQPFIPEQSDLGPTLGAKLNELEGQLITDIKNIEAGYTETPSGQALQPQGDLASKRRRLMELRAKAAQR